LTVVGVSDEDEAKIEAYVQAKKPKYPIVRAADAMDKFGGKFYPSYFTIGSDGVILTVPDDRMPDEKLLEESLAKVVLFADLPKTPFFDAIRKDWLASRFGKVAKQLATTSQDPTQQEAIGKLKAKLDGMVASELEAIDKLAPAEDPWAAVSKLETTARRFEGVEVAAKARAKLDALNKDPSLQKEIVAGRSLDKLRASFDLSKSSGKRGLAKALEPFVKRHKGTKAAVEAHALIDSLR
jgi:hypothetical protein